MRLRSWVPLAAVLVLALSLSADHPQPRVGKIEEAGHMHFARSGHTATLLKDGRVLIVGGMVRNGEFLDSAEIYDPAKQTFTPTGGHMQVKRVGHTAALLKDGRVLLVGGWRGGIADSAELYDPATDRFTRIAMISPRARATATTLQDGRVLVTGGARTEDRVGQRSTEIFDPAAMKFTSAGDMKDGRIAHSATLLGDGTVLIVGGMAERRVLGTAELFDPKTNRFSYVGSMRQVRYKHTAQLLTDGRVLIAGGSDDRDWKGMLAEAEIYNPSTRTFTPAGDMAEKRFKLSDEGALLSDGTVLIAGGAGTAERFDPKNNRFESLASGTGTPQWYLSETSLPNGDVLLLGGYSTSMTATDKAWVYRR